MSQTKKQAHLETITNQFVGIAIGWLIVFLLFPLFDHLEQWKVATISTVLFFIASYGRIYLIRRWFNNKEGNKNE